MRKKARPQDFKVIWSELDAFSSLPAVPFKENDLAYIWFVSSPEKAAQSRSVRFFNKDEKHLFSIYLSGDNSGEVYETLCQRFGVTPVPKMRCLSCGSCSCDKTNKKSAHNH